MPIHPNNQGEDYRLEYLSYLSTERRIGQDKFFLAVEGHRIRASVIRKNQIMIPWI